MENQTSEQQAAQSAKPAQKSTPDEPEPEATRVKSSKPTSTRSKLAPVVQVAHMAAKAKLHAQPGPNGKSRACTLQ